jgi:Zn-dependent peptidase ImmA (M78 family)
MSIGRAGEEARRTLGLALEGPVPDLLRQVEDEVGLQVFIVSLGEGGIEGAYQQLEDERFVLVNHDRQPVRKRFTLAHEFGHHFLDHGSRFDYRFSFRDDDRFEREANSFAAELLAPRPAIDHWLSRRGDPKIDLGVLVRIASYFEVSAAVIRFRLENENRITSSAGGQFDADIRAGRHSRLARELGLTPSRDSITAHHVRGGYVPAAMQATIADLLQRELLSREAAASLLRISEKDAAEQIDEMLEDVDPTGDESSG